MSTPSKVIAKWTDRHTDRHTHTHRQTNRHTHRQTDTQTLLLPHTWEVKNRKSAIGLCTVPLICIKSSVSIYFTSSIQC